MARRPRFEVEGGLYHIITRGVDRQDYFPFTAGSSKVFGTADGVNGATAILSLCVLVDDESCSSSY